MGSLRRTPSSRRDCLKIWLYIAQDNMDAADRLIREFDRVFDLLAEHPEAGPDRSELRPWMRSFPVGKYLIFYRKTREGVEIIRVIHGMRDLPRIFQRRKRLG